MVAAKACSIRLGRRRPGLGLDDRLRAWRLACLGYARHPRRQRPRRSASPARTDGRAGEGDDCTPQLDPASSQRPPRSGCAPSGSNPNAQVARSCRTRSRAPRAAQLRQRCERRRRRAAVQTNYTVFKNGEVRRSGRGCHRLQLLTRSQALPERQYCYYANGASAIAVLSSPLPIAANGRFVRAVCIRRRAWTAAQGRRANACGSTVEPTRF